MKKFNYNCITLKDRYNGCIQSDNIDNATKLILETSFVKLNRKDGMVIDIYYDDRYMDELTLHPLKD
jgi:hypothetical protein